MYIDFGDISPNQVYFTMIQTVVPRPVAWVLSENASGSYNLAPFSYFNAVCSDPPLLLISVGKKPDGSFKDTRLNIEQRAEFIVHVAHRDMLEPLNASSAMLAAGESELERLGLRTTAFPGSRRPRLRDFRVAFACTCFEIREIGEAPQSLILERITTAFIDDAVVDRDARGRPKICADRIDPLARLGGNEYMVFGDITRLDRPR